MHQTLEFVLEQSSGGHHHLFDADLVRRSFTSSSRIDREVVAGASQLLDGLRTVGGLDAQRQWILAAPDDVQRLFVRLYFDYLAGFMSRRGVVFH